MKQLERYASGSTIIEHRAEGPVVGRMEYAGINGDGSIGVGWNHDGGHRTTLFSPASWERTEVANVIFLKRVAEDEGLSDLPWRTASSYTIVLNNNR